MSFVDIWKVVAIVLTGVFGILGLVKEFKDKDTKRVTKWGWIALSGIVVSSVFGVIVQLKESWDAERSKTKIAAQTLAIIQNTDKAVQGIQRAMSPLDEPLIGITFDLACSTPEYRAFCTKFENKVRTQNTVTPTHPWEGWPGKKPDLPLHMFFFVDAKDADRFLQGLNPRANLLIDVMAVNHGTNEDIFVEPMTQLDGGIADEVIIDIVRYKPDRPSTDGKIASTLDLPGVTVVMTELNDQLKYLTLTSVRIGFKNGVSIASSGHFQKLNVNGQTAYRFVFPRDIE